MRGGNPCSVNVVECTCLEANISCCVVFAGVAFGLVVAVAVLSLLCSAATVSDPALPPAGKIYANNLVGVFPEAWPSKAPCTDSCQAAVQGMVQGFVQLLAQPELGVYTCSVVRLSVTLIASFLLN